MINKYSIAGISAVFATTAALAADLPSRREAPAYVPPVTAVPYSWTGFEFGLTTSVSIPNGQRVTTTPFGGAAPQPAGISLNKAGFDDIGGGIAANYQFKPGSGVVIGAMADVDYFNLHAYENVGIPAAIFQERLSYLGTANGRLGYAFDRLLIYAVGGLAFGDVHNSGYFYSGFAPGYFGTASSFRTGYNVGGGFEYAIPADSILNKLSVEKLLGIDKKLGLDIFEGTIRAEYVHYDLGTQTVNINSFGPAPGSYVSTFKTQGNLVRIGLGYKYNGLSGGSTPVVARY